MIIIISESIIVITQSSSSDLLGHRSEYNVRAVSFALMCSVVACWVPGKVPAISLEIMVKETELRAGETITMDCLAGSSNPEVNISWSLGPIR